MRQINFAVLLFLAGAVAFGCGRTPLDGASEGGNGPGGNGAAAGEQGGDGGSANQGGGQGGGGSGDGGSVNGGSGGSGGGKGGKGGKGGNGGGPQGGNVNGGSGGTGGTPNRSLVIVPSETTLNLNETRSLQALLRTGNVTENVTVASGWKTDRPEIVRVDNGPGAAGRVTALREGSALVFAGFSGLTAQARVTVAVDRIVSITVTPGLASMTPGGIAAFTATTLSSSGRQSNVTGEVTWMSSDPMTVGFVPGDAPGVVRAFGQGKAAITASLNGINGSATAVVEQNNNSKMSVDPFTAARQPGETVDFRATSFSPNGTQRNVTGVATWTSSNGEVASVARGGRATCHMAGTAMIVATFEGASASATLTCRDVQVVALRLSPSETSVPVKTQIQYTATAFFSDNTSRVVTSETTFSSSDARVVTTTTRGLATAQGEGTASIKGAWRDFAATAAIKVFQR